MTVFLYQKLSPLVSLNALSAFFMATGLILLTLIPVIFLYQCLIYQCLINKKPSVAAFTYCQFVITAEILSLLANQTWQWDFFTIILTLCLYFIFSPRGQLFSYYFLHHIHFLHEIQYLQR